MSLKDWFALVRECPNPWREIRVLRTERDGLIAAGVESDQRAFKLNEKYGVALGKIHEMQSEIEKKNELLLETNSEYDTLYRMCTDLCKEKLELRAQLAQARDAVEQLKKAACVGD